MGTPSPQPESTPDNPIGSSAERSIPTSECLATPQPSRSHSLTVKPWAVQSLGMPAILASPFTKHSTPIKSSPKSSASFATSSKPTTTDSTPTFPSPATARSTLSSSFPFQPAYPSSPAASIYVSLLEMLLQYW
eukprot:CAMPEP_0181192642 /NCGR_PEP_ID=MMETSP1096-20121128/13394_1 /TAXON_ID=156174 ORGANISM="Chrysochromulina ericina, Strain CCMP281" /NCGR_SAMPLE_ID=MMETSP1096 /ASSEMBLY_ACC=CAM_ASM_000453 /LENGTH=133 /DNA_ID=CAMNT_0023282055 /DNA_START=436 /DNA_END=834 /DNA_ORIENTATION=-